MNSAELAAWVQGVGSLLAVGVAAWVGLLPQLAERGRAARERAAFHEIVQMAVIEVMDPVHRITAAISERNVGELKSQLKRLTEPALFQPLRHILSLPPTQWPSMGLYLSAMRFERAAGHLSELRPVPPQATLYPEADDPFWSEAKALVFDCELREGVLWHLSGDKKRPPKS